MTDSEILRIMEEAPPQGQRALFYKYYGYVCSIVNRILSGFGSREDSEECVIDVFASVMMKLRTDKITSLSAYVGAAARNSAISMRRKLAARAGLSISADDENTNEIASEENIEEAAEKRESSEVLLQCISELGTPDSVIIIQKYYYGKSSKEISGMTGISASLVRVRCGRAMKRLKKLLEENGITL